MSRFAVSAVAAGVMALVGVEVYGIYSIRHVLDTRLTRIEGEIESVRATETALASQVAPAANREPEGAKAPVAAKPNTAKATAGPAHIVLDPKVAAKLQKLLPA